MIAAPTDKHTARDGLPTVCARLHAPTRTPCVRNSVHLELRDVPSRCTPNETNRDPDNNVALSTRTSASTRRHSEDFVLPRARACQSIIRIGLLKFLGTDGERMDIHSFGPALTKARELARSIPFGLYDIYVHGHMLSDSGRVRRGSRACHLIS